VCVCIYNFVVTLCLPCMHLITCACVCVCVCVCVCARAYVCVHTDVCVRVNQIYRIMTIFVRNTFTINRAKWMNIEISQNIQKYACIHIFPNVYICIYILVYTNTKKQKFVANWAQSIAIKISQKCKSAPVYIFSLMYIHVHTHVCARTSTQ